MTDQTTKIEATACDGWTGGNGGKTLSLTEFLERYFSEHSAKRDAWTKMLPRFVTSGCYVTQTLPETLSARPKRYRFTVDGDTRFVSERNVVLFLTRGHAEPTLPAPSCQTGCINPYHQREVQPAIFKSTRNVA